MNSREEKERALGSYTQSELESPFFKEELFVGETDMDLERRLGALEAESPFQSVFEQGLTILSDSEELVEKLVKEDEFARELDENTEDEAENYNEIVFSYLKDKVNNDFEEALASEESETDLEIGEVIMLPKAETDETDETVNNQPMVSSLRMRKTRGDSQSSLVRARILWPTLGFPSVISPRDWTSPNQMLNSDSSRCICVLLLSNRKYLSKEEAAWYLRYVPWKDRSRRHIPPNGRGTFAQEDIIVRNDVNHSRLTIPEAKNSLSEIINFGSNKDGENGVTVSLANYVRDFYRKEGFEYLCEIRVSEEASKRLSDGIYHIFWNNEDANENVSSDEMALLLKRFAMTRRGKKLWEKHGKHLLNEYKYEYDMSQLPNAKRCYTEILHPLHVQRSPTKSIKIGHLTDTHINVRAYVYNQNLKNEKINNVFFNNCNESFRKVYNDAKQDSNAIFLTGDLIDYSRGFWGKDKANQLGNDSLYHVDRNWFLFYYLLASSDAYQIPVYTILGNHDWRLNPYPPFAPGSPNPNTLIHNYTKFNPEEQKSIIRKAHGKGHDRKFSYYLKATGKWKLFLEHPFETIWQVFRMTAQKQTIDKQHTPAETTIESVAWYLLSINPFLDYSFTLPGNYKALMLDWAEDENLLFPIVSSGKSYPYFVWQAETASSAGPKARNCLTDLQKTIVKYFFNDPGKAKIIGIHAPPISPYPDWYDWDLLREWKIYDPKKKARGPTNYAIKMPDGTIKKLNGHPIFAIRPYAYGAYSGTVADYGSFEHEREWFIKMATKPSSNVSLVLSGHTHRNGLFVVRLPNKKEGSAIAGKGLVRGLLPPAEISTKQVINIGRKFPFRLPLYIITTSSALRGYFSARQLTEEENKSGGFTIDPGYSMIELTSDGIIQSVEFRFVRP